MGFDSPAYTGCGKILFHARQVGCNLSRIAGAIILFPALGMVMYFGDQLLRKL